MNEICTNKTESEDSDRQAKDVGMQIVLPRFTPPPYAFSLARLDSLLTLLLPSLFQLSMNHLIEAKAQLMSKDNSLKRSIKGPPLSWNKSANVLKLIPKFVLTKVKFLNLPLHISFFIRLSLRHSGQLSKNFFVFYELGHGKITSMQR